MFTGLIEEIGTVRTVRRTGRYQLLEVSAERVLENTVCGDSIAVDGACQTVTAVGSGRFAVETLAVTLEKTTLGGFRPGRRVHLERALTPGSRMGGHFVQGHVDGTGRVVKVREENRNVYFSVELSETLARYCVAEGSIAIDGVSLTIAVLDGTVVTINGIPTTWRDTAFADRRTGEPVNIEVDILSRYVERLFLTKGSSTRNGVGTAEPAAAGPTHAPHGLTEERLWAFGY